MPTWRVTATHMAEKKSPPMFGESSPHGGKVARMAGDSDPQGGKKRTHLVEESMPYGGKVARMAGDSDPHGGEKIPRRMGGRGPTQDSCPQDG